MKIQNTSFKYISYKDELKAYNKMVNRHFLKVAGILFVIIGLLISLNTFGQQTNNNDFLDYVSDDQNVNLNASARFINGTVYINWTVDSLESNCLFVVKRSFTGMEKDFEVIAIQQGFSTKLSVMYNFQEKQKSVFPVYYSVSRITNNEEDSRSKTLSVYPDQYIKGIPMTTSLLH